MSTRGELGEQLRMWSRAGVVYLARSVPARTEAPAEVPPPSVETVPAPRRAPESPLTELLADRPAAWGDLDTCRTEALQCTRCPLSQTRKSVVFGEGDPHARLMFVGEAPGADEDRLGRPFVGRAGQLLDKMIVAMGLRREEVYIANVLKCRPPENRDPLPHEAEACRPFLEAQISLITPEIICCLGRHAAVRLLGRELPLNQLRGPLHRYNDCTRVSVTYHPAYCLRNPASKRDVWEDLQVVMKELGLPQQS